MPTDPLALPSAGRPPSHHPPACPAPSPICDLSPICPPHASSRHRCLSAHTSYLLPSPISCINLARNNVQLPTPHLSPYLNTDSLFAHGFPSLTPMIIIRTAFDT